jgi:LasA protease
MARLLKHGIASNQKIKSNGRRLATFLVVGAWILSIIACSQGYISPVDLTATADPRSAQTDDAVTPTPDAPTATAAEASPIDSPEAEATLTETPPAEPSTFTPAPTETATASNGPTAVPPVLYYTQAGDTLNVLSIRFDVKPEEITSPDPISSKSFMSPGQLLIIPNKLGKTSPATLLIPDSDVVDSPSTLDFDVEQFVAKAGGYLSTYKEPTSNGWNTGAQVVERVATESSVNPRLLLSLLEFQSHWVFGQPSNMQETTFPMGYIENNHKTLYTQLNWVAEKLSVGYYYWREGLLTGLIFTDGSKIRLAPPLNAGTVAVQFYLSTLMDQGQWNTALYTPDGFPDLHKKMFGDAWLRAQTVEPLFPPNLQQPKLELPFRPGHTWALTYGPHGAWQPEDALAAIDLAPSSAESGCVPSTDYVTAMAPGLVIRSDGNGALLVDLDGDGKEQTGWVILYMHIKNPVPVGTWLNTNDFIGYPSCLGGKATGTHTHIARKYNGEWMPADGPIPFDIGGWIAYAGQNPGEGGLVNGDKKAVACQCSSYTSLVTRPKDSNPEDSNP